MATGPADRPVLSRWLLTPGRAPGIGIDSGVADPLARRLLFKGARTWVGRCLCVFRMVVRWCGLGAGGWLAGG
jgi:hypothetical protein